MKSFEYIANTSGDIIFLCSTKGEFTFVNHFAERLIGLESTKIIGRHFTEFISERNLDETKKHFEDFLKDKKTTDYYEFPIKTNSGNELWIGQSTNLYRDEFGKVEGFFGIARPITKLKSVEHLLSESETKLQSVIDSALDAVIVINEEGRITEWNRQAERTFGWSKERVLGVKLSNTIIPENYREAHEKGMKHFLKTGEGPVLNQRIEITAINSSGVEFPVELTIIPNKIDGVYFFSSFVRDLTEDKKSERILKAINELAINLLGKTTLEEIGWEIAKNTIEKLGFEDCVVYVLDDETQMLHQIAAYGPKKAKDDKVLDPISIPVGKGIVGRVAKIGAPIMLDDTSKDPQYIVDDDVRYSELCVPIVEGDRVIGVIDSEHKEKNFFKPEHLDTLSIIANLVSTQLANAIAYQQKEKAERSLRESEERWHKLVDNQPEAIQITDRGKLVYLNSAGLELYEVETMEQILGKNLIELSTRVMKPEFEKRLKLLEQGEKVPSIEFEITTFKGNMKMIEVTSTPVVYNGKKAIQTIARDVTEKKKEEAKREKLLNELKLVNDQLQEFAHVVSHDLKAPLRAISSLSEWVIEDYAEKLDEEGRKTLNLIIDNVEKMDELIEGILTYSTSSGSTELDEDILISKMIDTCISNLDIPQHIKVEVQNNLPMVRFNRIQLTQVFQNLISNAIKFLDKDLGLISVNCSSENGKWIFSISDNGPGIPDSIGNQVFDLFSKVDENKEGSTGIGLSIVKKIIENKSEKIWFKNNEEVGVTFFFTLPKNEAYEKSEISFTS
ncbi:MAG: PAS domain S-box protein [Balneola sp.]